MNGDLNATVASSREVSDSWRRWITENKLLRSTAASMVAALAASGVDEDSAREEIRAVAEHPYYQGADWVAQRLRKLESLVAVWRSLADQAHAAGQVERRSHLSRGEFLERYYALNRPVILTDALRDWKALDLWRPEYLKRHFGDQQVEIMSDRDRDPRYEIESNKHKKNVWFSDYIDRVFSGDETNDYYLAGNNRLFDKPWAARLLDDITILPEYLDGRDTSGKMFFWFGPAGTVTPLHHDTMNILMAQVVGRKRVKLIPASQWPFVYNSIGVYSDVDPERPDFAACPLFRQATVIDVVLSPGEVLFLPVGWWHHVRALDVSITVTFTNFVFDNRYEWDHPHIVRR